MASVLSVCLMFGLGGCSKSTQSTVPNPLRIGVVPNHPKEQLEAMYAPLVRYLGETLQVRTQLIIPSTREELGNQFHRGELDLAFFGGIEFVKAEQRDGAIPIAVRALDRQTSAVVIVRAGLAGNFPADFRGRSFAFGPASATTAGRVPSYLFGQMQLVPEKFFSAVTHLPDTAAVLAAVQAGRVDAGVVSGLMLLRQVKGGSVDSDRFRRVWESPAFANAAWAVPPRIPLEVRARFRDALLALDVTDPDQEKIMAPLGARANLPATRADFTLLRQIVTGNPDYSAHERR